METVERALGDLRVSSADGAQAPGGNGGGGGRGGRGRGGQRGQESKPAEMRVPTGDFDFAGNNARFDKDSLRTPKADAASPGTEDGEGAEGAEEEEKAYNPQKSFFDALTPARGGPGGGERGRGRGGRGGRSRRDEERDKNVATFGEPGGVGLLGPGAYVGGWGGYGRRGGGRGGRRGGHGQGTGGQTAAGAAGR